MPTVTIDVETLFALLGKHMSDSEFEDVCFDFGIELEESTTTHKQQLKLKEKERKIYKIDIPANRYDMLCVEGIAMAIKTYLQLAPPAIYTTTKPTIELKVEQTTTIRPYVVAAVLRNIELNPLRYEGFIELQDKLHNNICRKRTLVAIGTHDLDKVEAPFFYKATAPTDFKFIPLNQTKEMNGKEMMEFYKEDRKLSKFLHIIKDSPVYPVILDKKERVLSVPPIINGDHSKISVDTKNIFIECTATDITKARIVLNTIVTIVEQVKVVYADRVEVTPDLSDRDMTASVKYINACVGIQQTGQELANLVEKMSLKATLSKDGTELLVKVPPTRADVLHQCDIMEDAAIAYNINKIVETFPKANCVSVPLPINKLSDMIRKECAFAGFTEALAFTLCSHDENFKFLNKKENHEAVVLANPKTVEYQVVRTSLLPGILKTVSSNKHLALPLRLFECSDIVLRDESVERRARNQRNLCILYTGKTSGFEEIHGMVDRMMLLLGVDQKTYSIRESECETFFKGRRADLVVDGKVVGTFGVLHPDVLEHFEIGSVCSALELNLEVFL